MATTIEFYDHAWKLITGGLNLHTANISVRLVTSGYTFNAAHTLWDNGANDATDPSHHEAADGNGYATGGVILANMVVTNSKLTPDDVVWTALTKTFRHVIGVANGSVGGLTDPLLFRLLPDDAPADVISNGSNYSILWNDTDGLFYRPAP
jgi:hypothetical protein